MNSLYKMIKRKIDWFILIIIFALFFLSGFIIDNCYSKELQPTITFTYPTFPVREAAGEEPTEEEIQQALDRLDHFELHWIPVHGSGIIEYLFTLEDNGNREWEIPIINMNITEQRPFYLVAVFTDGTKGFSNPYEFTFIKGAVILSVQKTE